MSEILEQLRWPGITVNGRNCELIMELQQPESKWVEDEENNFEPFFMDMSKHRRAFVELIGPGRTFSKTAVFHHSFLDYNHVPKLIWMELTLEVLSKGRKHWKESK